MCLPARSSICFGHVMSGNNSETATARVAKGAIASGIGTLCSSPIGVRQTAPGGIATGWLFWTHSRSCSPGAGAGRPAYRSAGQALASCVQESVPPRPCSVGLTSENVERIFDDVVPGRADDVQKKLPAKLGQSKPLADLPTVENDGACGRLAALGPLGQDLATLGKQASSSR